uniref:Collagenase NC10/endostatin domain-containing protein n=1 Tax=Oncorhynchus kisutch TaxID=8019 RepID=A0A8C7GIW2_ONCKI
MDDQALGEGSMAYVSDKGELYVRARDGWCKVQVLYAVTVPQSHSYRPHPPHSVLSKSIDFFLPQLHLVALNAPFSGDMRGIRGADFQCYQQARTIGLTATYRAFMSSHLQDLATIVKKEDRYSMPVINLKGEVLYGSWMNIFSGNGGVLDPSIPIYSFDGRNVMTDPTWPQKLVWHGSSTVGIRMTTNYCEAWRAGDMAVTGQASLLQTGRLLGQHTRSCSNRFVVLCIENSYTDHRRSN